MKKLVPIVAALVVLSLVWVLPAGCVAEEQSRTKIVTSTSLMEYIAEQVGGDRVDVFNLVPPNQHPGNFDVKPGDIQNLAGAHIFLLHGWPGEGYAERLIASASNPDIFTVTADIPGNWMIPSVQLAATERVMSILIEIDAKNAVEYRQAAEAYGARIRTKEADIRDRLPPVDASTVNVIASARQAEFLQWAGFNVVATFPGSLAMTPQATKDLIDLGRDWGVTLVVNNLQDGKDAGIAIARELGARNLNLSNFPGGFAGTETWEKAIDYNIDVILDALARAG